MLAGLELELIRSKHATILNKFDAMALEERLTDLEEEAEG